MLVNKHDKYASVSSDFLSVTFNKLSGAIAFFGVESSGRDRDKHASYNLMLPGYGGVFGAFKKGLPTKKEFLDNGIVFENEKGCSASYVMSDPRTLSINLNGVNKNDIYSTRLAVKTAPPSIWTKKAPKHLKSTNPYTIYKTKYALPLIVHFPDFGRVEISASSKDVYCVEELQLSKDFAGLDLGHLNYGFNHNRMHALHYGSSFLTLKSNKPLDSVELTFRVMEECYPSFPDENDERFNGLKRNWPNAFALNRELFDMGDNIYFHGTGHLAIHMKVDLLYMMDGKDEYFKIVRKTYEKQVARTFTESQAHDGEVSVNFFKREKGKNHGCAVDSTPGAIIALTGISKWNLAFAKKFIPNAMKAADFLLSLDSDNDGIFEVCFPGDYIGQPSEFGGQCNWWDNFAFGHKDIYFNYLCHRALRELCALLDRVNMSECAEKYKKQLEKFDASFFDTFYNPETELMTGWISRNGKVHDYAFTFAVSMGINEGLIPYDIGKKMILKLLGMMEKEGYGDLRYGIPGNLVSVEPPDTGVWPCMTDWGQYENGGLNGMNGYHFLTAMYRVGLKKEADDILFAILNTYEKHLTHSGLMPGYCQSIDWRTKNGVPCGYNYLADNYYFLLSVYTGRYNMKHPSVVKK